MESSPTDSSDHPQPPITLTSITIYTNPFEELAEAERKAIEAQDEEKKQAAEQKAKADVGAWYSDPGATLLGGGSEYGPAGEGNGRRISSASVP